MRNREKLIKELKALIIESLKLEDMNANEVGTDMKLFGEGLGLDSIDALELVTAIEREYGLNIPDEDIEKGSFVTVGAIADYIIDNGK